MDEDAAMGEARSRDLRSGELSCPNHLLISVFKFAFWLSELVHAIFKLVWRRRAERSSGGGGDDVADGEPAPETSRRNRSTSANASALKVSCELLRIFVTEAIQRSAFIAEAEESTVIEPTHLERSTSAKLGKKENVGYYTG
ncbi:hypothetical protein EJB05_39075, partial [Eragrostis curvula]